MVKSNYCPRETPSVYGPLVLWAAAEEKGEWDSQGHSCANNLKQRTWVRFANMLNGSEV